MTARTDLVIPDAVVEALAGASWLLPTSALLLLGFSERGGAILERTAIGSSLLGVLALVAAGAGLVLGVFAWLLGRRAVAHPPRRRRALLGIFTSGCALTVVAIASVSGARSGESLRRVTDRALHDSPGWNGGLAIDGALVLAMEVGAGSELAWRLLGPYDRPYRVMLLAVDNTRGQHEVVLSREGAVLRSNGGEPIRALAPADLLARATDSQRAVVEEEVAPVHVPVGDRIDGVKLLFEATASFRDAHALDLRIDDAMRTIPGRYFTLEEKRAIDREREAKGAR